MLAGSFPASAPLWSYSVMATNLEAGAPIPQALGEVQLRALTSWAAAAQQPAQLATRMSNVHLGCLSTISGYLTSDIELSGTRALIHTTQSSAARSMHLCWPLTSSAQPPPAAPERDCNPRTEHDGADNPMPSLNGLPLLATPGPLLPLLRLSYSLVLLQATNIGASDVELGCSFHLSSPPRPRAITLD
jgi:hypothetical protein